MGVGVCMMQMYDVFVCGIPMGVFVCVICAYMFLSVSMFMM